MLVCEGQRDTLAPHITLNPPMNKTLNRLQDTRHASPIARHTSHVTHHTSHITPLHRSFHISSSYCGESHLSSMNMSPSLIMHDMSKQSHVILSIGAADGCAVTMARDMMQKAPNLKHALLLQV